MGCLFCAIIRKEIPARIVFENERLLAFRDINPQAPVHVLIVTKKHIPGLNDITGQDSVLLGEVHQLARQIAEDEGIAKSGWRLVCNCGADAGQSVEHIHFHLLGGRVMQWPPG